MSWEKSKSGKLQKEFVFNKFTEAIAFINKIAVIAEDEKHHPDILIHDYNKVTIMLVTHDTGDVTEKDYSLAESIDKL